MVESLIIRVLARLMALGALTGSFILLIICNIGTPVFNQFNYSETTFDDGGDLKLGIWGACYTSGSGQQQCSKTSVGYNFSPAGLPAYSANSGGANVNIVNKPLSESLIFVPLALGSTGLALLLVLLPIRIVTLMCIFACFLAVGATGIAFVLAIICFAQANARLGLLFNPNTVVHPMIGHCVWFLLACTTVNVGSFLFMVIALSPSKKNKEQPIKSYGDPVGRNEKVDGIDYGYRKPGSTRSRSTRPVYNAYDDDLESRNGNAMGRSASRHSHRSERSGRSRDRRDSRDYDEPDRRSARRSHSARRSRRYEEEEDDYSPGY